MAWNHLMGIIVFLILAWFVWYFTGGPQRYEVTQPFIKAPAPLDTGAVYGK